jgi:hypothetical protein
LGSIYNGYFFSKNFIYEWVMNQMPVLEQVLIVVVTVLVVLWIRPGLKAALKQSRQAQHKDWQSLLLPLGLVILFVLLLIALV